MGQVIFLGFFPASDSPLFLAIFTTGEWCFVSSSDFLSNPKRLKAFLLYYFLIKRCLRSVSVGMCVCVRESPPTRRRHYWLTRRTKIRVYKKKLWASALIKFQQLYFFTSSLLYLRHIRKGRWRNKVASWRIKGKIESELFLPAWMQVWYILQGEWNEEQDRKNEVSSDLDYLFFLQFPLRPC